MDGLEILGFCVHVSFISGGVVIVFLASPVNYHALFILFVFHCSKIVGYFGFDEIGFRRK